MNSTDAARRLEIPVPVVYQRLSSQGGGSSCSIWLWVLGLVSRTCDEFLSVLAHRTSQTQIEGANERAYGGCGVKALCTNVSVGWQQQPQCSRSAVAAATAGPPGWAWQAIARLATHVSSGGLCLLKKLGFSARQELLSCPSCPPHHLY